MLVVAMELENNSKDLGHTLRTQALILGGFVVILWLLEMVDWLAGSRLDQFGISPRNIGSVWGIFAAPFLHAGFGHVAANTIPFLVLGWFVMLRGLRTFFIVSLIVVVVGGLGTWLIGPANSIHLGASGLVFGYFGYLLLRGYFERSWPAIAWSIVVLVLYGGMLLGVLPRGAGVSWQMHLFGFIGGGLSAYLLTRELRRQQASFD